MAYSEALAERIRAAFGRRRGAAEKKMFGGIGFLQNGNMCVGVWKTALIARIGPEQYEGALKESNVKVFDITGRAMKGWVLIEPDGIENDSQLADWIGRAVEYVETLPPK